MLKRVRVRAAMLVAIATIALTGCDAAGPGGFFAGSSAKAPRNIRLLHRQVLVEGPAGFCVDKASRLENGSGAFVVLGSCAALSGNRDDDEPTVPAVLTISVARLADGQGASPDDLEAFFGTDAGRASLAQSGQAAHAELLSMNANGRALIIQAKDTSDSRAVVLADDYWRGVFMMNGHLVNLSVSALNNRAFSRSHGKNLLLAFMASMQNANPVQESGGGGLMNLFN